ncbi:hypothetical protein [Chryseobacterium limigenitum]|uniref:MukB N-terminal domain-containing protein n=1 Tax=Chryseobacterium limigenitum TaxID=1612149 RepID=A0A1K2IKP2_9FLAO|nr:hypothetical protein [Chryseobacterium limigenitum]SFZ93009.1 hypothetical protein SAMN05216324_10485 [Chryseobacterium limigenitum]
MKNPLIYSLSTVGILKHYNQDYLIHPQRTDFTGSNGVGKSIIADLFQLIFINERPLFQFGTEGYKKEVRQIHKLAYKCRDAYAFLTIEIQQGKFICLGVCIPNTTSRPIRPFLITSDPDNSKDFKDRAFPADKIPYFTSFINERGQICIVDELSKRFRDKYDLYFESFPTRDKKDEHYANLFDKHILPINLSVPSSLKAFAKIIQSFSRARSEGEKSDALKEFLFDGNVKELEESFDTHKNEIEKLLNDFEELQKFITDLENKQGILDELKIHENRNKNSHKEYLFKKTGYYLSIWRKNKIGLDKIENEYSGYLDTIDRLGIELPRIKSLASSYQKMHEWSKDRVTIIQEAQQLSIQIKELKERSDQFEIKDPPIIKESFTGLFVIDDYTDEQIIKYCKDFLPIYSDYESLSAIETQLEDQMRKIDSRKAELLAQAEYLQMVNILFAELTENSLIANVLKSNIDISISQEAVLFHFIEARWQKPESASVDFFADGFDFFDEENIIKDENLSGYWLRFKDLNIYIKPLDHEPILQDATVRDNAISELINKNKQALKKIRSEQEQIRGFERGDTYDIVSAPLLSDLDNRLNNLAVLKNIELTVQLTLQLEHKIKTLTIQREIVNGELAILLESQNIKKDADLVSLEKKENILTLAREKKHDTFKQRYTRDDATLNTLTTIAIPGVKRDLDEKQQQERKAHLDYVALKTDLKGAYGDQLEAEAVECTETQMRDAQEQSSSDRANYRTLYQNACEKFDETKDRRNNEITTEIDEGNFRFELLERILLGKIHFKDDISEELRTANRSRHNLIDSIHETMLKIFAQTKNKYDIYERQIRDLNLFFKGRKISKKYYFQVEFHPNKEIPISWITQLQSQSQQAYKPGELPMGSSVESFVEDFFRRAANYKKKVGFRELLDPRTYFTLDAGLSDEKGNEISGSTGETYTAKVLLGIGRLSKVQSQNRPGLRFIILEETANLDKTNFNNFPEIADEFGYQIITMTPKPFGADSDQGWYLHHLLPGKENSDINYPVPSSYFKTNLTKQDLLIYLNNRTKNNDELDSFEGVK